MPEFAGYVSNRGNVVDWQDAAAGLSGAIKSVDQARQQRRAENERIMSESEQLINDTEQPKSQTLNNFILKGADLGRSKLFEWNRQLKQGTLKASDYKSRIANLNEYWSNLAAATKTLDTRMTQAMARQQPGADGTLPPASAIEAEMQMYFGGLSQLGDKNIIVDEDGRVKIGKFDANGNLVGSEDVKYINNPANVEFNRTDLSGMVNADIKNWGEWSIGRVSDLRNNPQYKRAKARLEDALVGTPRSAASILVDNTDGDYQVYFNEEDKQAKVQKLKELYAQTGEKKSDKEIEDQLILMRQDQNGDYQPNLTPAQIEAAKKLVDSEIELQVGRVVAPAPSIQRDNGPSWEWMYKKQEEQEQNLQGYIASREAWINNDVSKLPQGYVYKRGKSKQFVTKDNPDGSYFDVYVANQKDADRDRNTPNEPVKRLTSAEGLAEFVFAGEDPNKSLYRWKEGKSEFLNRGLNNDPRYQYNPSGKQNQPSASDFDSKWKTLKKGQRLQGPDGVWYTKK
jgi:hypothetical protein